MELDFYLEQIDNYTIKVFDNTLSTQVDTIGDIYQMSLDVVCSKIPNEQVLGLDCLNHVLTYHRDKEIYEITSDVYYMFLLRSVEIICIMNTLNLIKKRVEKTLLISVLCIKL